MSKDLDDAVAAAIASANAEVEAAGKDEAEPAPEPAPEAAPAEDKTPEPEADTAEKPVSVKPGQDAKPDKPAADTDDDDAFFTPTAEQLALIDKSPELKAVYRSMQRGLTKKTQGIAEFRKQVEQRVKLADWVQSDPQGAVRALAAATGMTIAEAKAAVKEETDKIADPLVEKWTKTIGSDATGLLRPLVEETIQTMLKSSVNPLYEEMERSKQESAARGIAASLAEFGATVEARGDGWDDDIQAEMAELSTRMLPAEGTTIDEYLATLHDTVLSRRSRKHAARENLARLRRIKDEAEPTSTARPIPATDEQITADMSEKDAIALAVRQAQAQVSRRRR